MMEKSIDLVSKFPMLYQMIFVPTFLLIIMGLCFYIVFKIFGRKNVIKIKDALTISSEENATKRMREKTELEIESEREKLKIEKEKKRMRGK